MARKQLILSNTSIGKFFECPAYFYFSFILNFPEMENYSIIAGSAGHNIISRFHVWDEEKGITKIESSQNAVDEFYNKWDELLVEKAPFIPEYKNKGQEEEAQSKVRARGVNGVVNYAKRQLENNWFSGEWNDPRYVERYSIVEISGMRIRVKIDQARKVSESVLRLWRPDLVSSGQKILESFKYLIIDFKFAEPKDIEADPIDKQVHRVYREGLSSSERRQSTLYYYAYQTNLNLKKPPLGFGFIFPASDVVRFFVPQEEDISHLVGEVKLIGEAIQERRWERRPSKYKCKKCCFLRDCRGESDEYMDIPVQKVPAVELGVPTWWLEKNGNQEGTQGRLF